MNSIEHGLQSYRSHDVNKAPRSSHPLDVLSSILFDIKTENRRRENQTEKKTRSKENDDDFRDVLKREMEK